MKQKFKLGDKVFCIVYQRWGKIILIDHNAKDPYFAIMVDFSSDIFSSAYNLEGYRRGTDIFPSLYHEIPDIVTSKGEPTLPFNHMLDIAFTVNSAHENWEGTPIEDVMEALQKHIKYLASDLSEFRECLGYCDTIEL